MVSYRFLRPDDLPLIAHGVNRCFNVHFPHLPEMTLDRLKQEVGELNVWASSCMAALEGGEPVAILVGAKRSEGNLIYRIGVRPDYQRQGHGRHLLESLAGKLAIIGPPALMAEIPRDSPTLGKFFKAAGYAPGAELVDFHLEHALPQIEKTEAIQRVSLRDLLPFKQLWQHEPEAWARRREVLENRQKDLQCIAVVSADSIEAFLITRFNPDSGFNEICRFGFGDPRLGLVYQTLLIRHYCIRDHCPVRIPKLNEAELPFPLLASLGFTMETRYDKYNATASS